MNWISKRRSVFIVLAILLLLIAGVVSAASVPPFFVQAGSHFFGGPSLLSADGIYHCDPSSPDSCVPIKENLVAAVANDFSLRNWWPVRAEFFSFE